LQCVAVCCSVSIKKGILYIVATLYHVWKLQISFRKRASICRALLQKETRKEKASFGTVTHGCITAHIWMSYVTHMNESCHTYEWVMSHIWMSHVTHMRWGMPHKWMRHATHMNESRPRIKKVMTHTWGVMSHTWMSHHTHMIGAYHSQKLAMSHT